MTRQDWRLLAVLLSDRVAASTVPENRELLMSLSLVATSMAEKSSAPDDDSCDECGALNEQRGPGYWFMQHQRDCPNAKPES